MSTSNPEEPKTYQLKIVWRNVILISWYHFFALQGLYYLLTLQIQWRTFIWSWGLGLLSGQGITSGAHRLWAHRTYKAKLPLRILLCFFQTIAFQNDIYEWVRDHRVHHKFSDTDADPHNSTRGFFFSHMGWLMVRKHPDVTTKGKTVDMSDVEKDPVVIFQKKYYVLLALLCSFVFPSVVPVVCWGEDMYKSWCLAAMFRYVLSLHFTWLINSAAHMWGTKPYDRTIKPRQNVTTSYLTMGEGFHNYHHTFPWDYKAAELGQYSCNWSTAVIESMAKLGLAYDLRTVSENVVKRRMMKTGVGTLEQYPKNRSFVESEAHHRSVNYGKNCT